MTIRRPTLFAISLLASCFLTASGQKPVPEAPEPKPSTPAEPNYRLSPGETIAMSVFDEPDLSVERQIDGSGSVSLPLVGSVNIGGKTTGEAAAAIAAAYKDGDFLKRPQVTVAVTAYRKRTVSILGEVQKPGLVEIPDGETKIDLMSAIAKAGGFNRIANKQKIAITRNKGSRTEATEKVNLQDLSKRTGTKMIELFPGDIVQIPQRIW